MLILVSGALLVALIWNLAQVPSNTGPWKQTQALAPSINIAGTEVTLKNLRDFRYDENGDVQAANYKTANFNLDQLERGWIGLSHFGSMGLAHSFFSFEFFDGEQSRFLVLSVEARLRKEQNYSPIAGLFRRYTKIYVFSTEQDVIGLRSHQLGERVLLYPTNVAKEDLRQFFLAVANDANELESTPQFYNTILDNCLTNLLKNTGLVDEVSAVDLKVLLPGRIDRLTYALNITPTDMPFREARHLATVDATRTSVDDPQFSASLRCGWLEDCQKIR